VFEKVKEELKKLEVSSSSKETIKKDNIRVSIIFVICKSTHLEITSLW